MNDQPVFEPTKTREAVARLLKRGPDAPDALELVREVVEVVREDALREDASRKGKPLRKGKPDATKTFNELLRQAGGFTPKPRVFAGRDSEARNALCIARVLAELARTKVIFADQSGETTWGWCALNRDAQGWCWSLLRCSEPAGFSEQARHDLREAKALIRQIIPIPEPCPYESRRPEWRPAEKNALDITE